MPTMPSPEVLPHTPFETYDPSKVPNCPASEGSKILYVFTTLPPKGPGSYSSECFLVEKLKSRVTNTPGFPTQPAQPAIPAHRVGPSPLNGLGMFATRNIKQGDLIFSERALIILPLGLPCSGDVSGLSAEDRQRAILHSAEQIVEGLFERMDPGLQKAYMSLHNSHKLDGSGPLFGVSRTNAYRIVPLSEEDAGNAGAYSGVFDQLSRINHSCAANTTRRFHMPSFSMRLYATRDIREGEEITSYYDTVWETTALRQARLDRYEFRCTCPSCSNAAGSDQRRAMIKARYNLEEVNERLRALPHMPRSPTTSAILMQDVEVGLRLFALEGLEGHAFYGGFLYYVCAVLSAVGADQTRFREYSLTLLKFWIIGGFDLGERFAFFQKKIVSIHRLHHVAL